MSDREELDALRRLAQLEAKAGGAPPQQQPSLGQQVGRQVGLAGRAVVNAATSLPLAAMEFGAGVGNLANRAMGRPGNYSPTADFEAGLDAAGVPRPETTTEKVVNFASTIFAGAKMPGQSPVPARAATAADKVVAEGVARHVPVYYDDVGGAMAKKIGTAAESLGPIGTGSGRAVQADAAKAAVGELAQNYGANAGADVPQLMQKGLQSRLAAMKRGANSLYTKVDTALAGAGNVDTTAVKAAIAARIAKEQQLGSAADSGTIATLEKYLNAPDGDFAHMRALRSALGDDISNYYTGKGAGSIGKRGADALQEAKDALDTAMAAHAKKAGGVGYDLWRSADKFYRTNIVPFKEAGFKDLAKTAEPEKVWRYLLSNNTESRAVRMFNGLNRQGRAAVKQGIIKEATDAATNPNGSFSPAKFAQYMEKNDNVVGTFFRGAEKQDIDGFTNLMRHIERAGQYAENPPTGNRLIPFILGGASFGAPKAAAAIAAGGLTVRGLFQTAAGRNMLMAAGKMKPGSPEMERLVQQISRLAASSQVAAESNDSGR